MTKSNGQSNINLSQAEFKGKVLQSLDDIKDNVAEVKESLDSKVSTKSFDREVSSLKKKTEQNFNQINALSKSVENYTHLHSEQQQLRQALEEQQNAQKESEKKIVRMVMAALIGGSFIWIKESREVIVDFLTRMMF